MTSCVSPSENKVKFIVKRIEEFERKKSEREEKNREREREQGKHAGKAFQLGKRQPEKDPMCTPTNTP